MQDDGAAALLQAVIAGWRYGCPRSQLVTLWHFAAVGDARQQQQQQQQSVIGPLADLTTLEGVLRVEYGMAVRQVAHADFIEGVRSLIDRDRAPRWGAHLAGATFPAHALFQSLPSGVGVPDGRHLLDAAAVRSVDLEST